jgi:hypothetical protein
MTGDEHGARAGGATKQARDSRRGYFPRAEIEFRNAIAVLSAAGSPISWRTCITAWQTPSIRKARTTTKPRATPNRGRGNPDRATDAGDSARHHDGAPGYTAILQFNKLDAQPTPEQRQRTEAYGIRWEYQMP